MKQGSKAKGKERPTCPGPRWWACYGQSHEPQSAGSRECWRCWQQWRPQSPKGSQRTHVCPESCFGPSGEERFKERLIKNQMTKEIKLSSREVFYNVNLTHWLIEYHALNAGFYFSRICAIPLGQRHLHAKALRLFSIKEQVQTPFEPNTVFSLQRPANFNLWDFFQTLEPITSLPEGSKRGKAGGNAGYLTQFGESTRHPSRNKDRFLQGKASKSWPFIWSWTQQSVLPLSLPLSWLAPRFHSSDSGNIEEDIPSMYCTTKMQNNVC